jgi:alpha-amylase
MTDVCLMFEVHQPFRLNRNFPADLLSRQSLTKKDLCELYFDNQLNKHIFDRATRKCYLPANNILLKEIERFKHENKQFQVSFGISGVFIEQCERWNPVLLESFKQLAETGCVEFLEETYYHSLSSLYGADRSEFIDQVKMHRQVLKDLFNYEPKVFENTECIYNNSIAKVIENLGYKAMITEGVERVLTWRSPNYVYQAVDSPLKVLLRNYRLSDDIGFRFSARWWKGWPLTAEKYSSWLAGTPGQAIVLFVDYETFGEHHWPETGIHDFLRWLPGEVNKWEHLRWSTPSEVVERHQPVGEVFVDDFNTVSWADLERDHTAWIHNAMQNISFEFLKGLEPLVKGIGDREMLRLWRYFQMSDHLYYMSIKGGGPGDVHSYFNPTGNPIEAFAIYSRILSDFEARLLKELEKPAVAAKWILRNLTGAKGFTFFYEFATPTPWTVYSLTEFLAAVKAVDISSVQFHTERDDFERWIREVIGDVVLADKLAAVAGQGLVGEALRRQIVRLIRNRIRQLEALAQKVAVGAV